MKQTLKEIAAILIAIDDGAEWEFMSKEYGLWVSPTPLHKILSCIADGYQIRLKPRTIQIGAFTVPEPLRVAPENQAKYYEVCISHTDYFIKYEWYNSPSDILSFNRGLIHATAEAAALHGKALASLTSKEPIE